MKYLLGIFAVFFLAIHFSLDKAHAKAIEKDLLTAAEKLNVDLVVDYR